MPALAAHTNEHLGNVAFTHTCTATKSTKMVRERSHDNMLGYLQCYMPDSSQTKIQISEIVASRVGGKDGINLPNHRLLSFNTYFFSLMHGDEWVRDLQFRGFLQGLQAEPVVYCQVDFNFQIDVPNCQYFYTRPDWHCPQVEENAHV
jgi:hypothetical protein